MKQLTLDISKIVPFCTKEELNGAVKKHENILRKVHSSTYENSDVLGWLDLEHIAPNSLISQIEEKAKEIRKNADVFLLIGVGGSNNAARAVIEALSSCDSPEIIYAGNNLSSRYMKRVIEKLEGKTIYANVIAKNFATFEPGMHFRVIRQYMESAYGEEEAGRRIIATASLNDSSLERLGNQKGYTVLPFTLDVGGRFSAMTPVGLLPMAVAGINIRELLKGAQDMKETLRNDIFDNIASKYAVARNLLLEKGYCVEILSSFEPDLSHFSKWWVQLFGESEGKDGKGIYPTQCNFSEDLHSLGQYIQQGKRMLLETFLNVEDTETEFTFPTEEKDIDLFNYLNGMDFDKINRTAYNATIDAHYEGSVPCMTLNIPSLSPYYFGQMMYMFMYSCYISAEILGVDPFNQPGVEAYKTKMIESLCNNIIHK